MTQNLLNYGQLESFPLEAFGSRVPFPWFELREFLTPEGFRALHESFPSLELFEKHHGFDRPYGQRPHDRYYLAYQTSIYHQTDRAAKGIVKREELSPAWQSLLEELETGEAYRNWIESLFEVTHFKVRFAWHIGVTGCEVSPHVDAPHKIGTHMVYFNTDEDWKLEWGGSTLVLSEKSTDAMNPDFPDFAQAIPIGPFGNTSLIFRNTGDAWHGMRPLTSPEGKYRRLFNIIFETPEAHTTPSRISSHRPWLKRIFG